MILYFMRHGKAEDPSHYDDDALRPLTEKGTKKVIRVAHKLKQLGVSPTVIYASPRVRAQQTAQAVASVLGRTVTTSELVNFGFRIDHVKKLVIGYPLDAQILFVGHNDSISDTVTALCGARVSLEVGAVASIATLPPMLENSQLLWLFTSDIAKDD